MLRRDIMFNSGLKFLAPSVPGRDDEEALCSRALKDFVISDHLGCLRHNGTLGTEVEGPVIGIEGTARRLPRPTLVWGTTEGFRQRPFTVLGFVESAMSLRGLEAWGRGQQAAFRRLVSWFFRLPDAPAWISVLPYKPKSDYQVQRKGGRTYNLTTQRIDRFGHRPQSIRLPGGFPELPLKGFRFVSAETPATAKEEFFGFHRSRLVEVPWRGFTRRRDDYVCCQRQPDGDGVQVPAHGDVLTDRAFYDSEANMYTNIHVWLCRIHRPADAPDFCNVTRMGIKVHPGDGRILNLHLGQQPLALLLEGQVLEQAMLKQAGAVRG